MAAPAPAAADTSQEVQPSMLSRVRYQLARQGQRYLDMSVPHLALRWVGLAVMAGVFCARIYFTRGFYIIAYGLFIYLLQALVMFLSPAVDPATQRDSTGILGETGRAGGLMAGQGADDGEEFRPFVRRLPEFKFWLTATKAVCISTLATFFSALNIEVFVPILVAYAIMLFCLTARKQVMHMIRYKYIPVSTGKQTYGKKKGGGASDSAAAAASATIGPVINSIIAPLGAAPSSSPKAVGST